MEVIPNCQVAAVMMMVMMVSKTVQYNSLPPSKKGLRPSVRMMVLRHRELR